MPVDTEAKRLSAVNVGWSWRTLAPIPASDGQVERATILGLYVGLVPVVVLVTGVLATPTLGTVSVTGAASASPTGVTATSANGSVTVTGAGNAYPTGVYATGMVGNVLIWQPIPAGPSGNWVPVVT